MMVCSPISTCAKSVVYLRGHMGGSLCRVVYPGPSSSCCFCFYPGNSKTKYLSVSNTISGSHGFGFQAFRASCFGSCSSSRQKSNLRLLTVKGSKNLEVSLACQSMKMRLLVTKQGTLPKFKCDVGPMSWPQGCASAGLMFGLLLCYSSSEPVYAEAAGGKEDEEDDSDSSHVKYCHGKKVYTDYSIIGIPGDGRCLFRSVAHEACLRSGKPAPKEHVQRELADDLRAKVAEEFIKRREETEWFVEGDFDTYVSQIRKPHVWGGEPELFMASHVLRMPITVYMYDKDAGGLIAIAEYGQEYGKENPIRVLYHGFGHYDALQIPGRKHGKSRL